MGRSSGRPLLLYSFNKVIFLSHIAVIAFVAMGMEFFEHFRIFWFNLVIKLLIYNK